MELTFNNLIRFLVDIFFFFTNMVRKIMEIFGSESFPLFLNFERQVDGFQETKVFHKFSLFLYS